MKILILNTWDIDGGAAKAACRLHRGLIQAGIASLMLVQFKTSDDSTVIGPADRLDKAIACARTALDSLPTVFYRNRTRQTFSAAVLPNRFALQSIREFRPDVVHLHWIGGGLFRIEDLLAIRRPIVWSLHDMWAFTGGCHYDQDCRGYLHGCGSCPVLGSARAQDLSRRVFLRKQRVYSKLPGLTIIGLSQWMAKCAKNSLLLGCKRVIRMPNLIDTDLYRRLDPIAARKLYKLPADKPLVLFGAVKATSDSRKGWRQLKDCLTRLRRSDIEVVIFGAGPQSGSSPFGFNAHYVGPLHDDVSMVTLYSACDVTVVPSLQENLSNIIMESLSCGTPVVAFGLGGNNDLVEHRINGYLAKPTDAGDLAKGIEWVLQDEDRWQELSRAARRKVEREFDTQRVVGNYIELYRNLKNSVPAADCSALQSAASVR